MNINFHDIFPSYEKKRQNWIALPFEIGII